MSFGGISFEMLSMFVFQYAQIFIVSSFPAFICHHNSFMIYGSLKEPTLSNWSLVTHVSVGSAVVVSVVFAAAGYATFTGYTQGKFNTQYLDLTSHCIDLEWISRQFIKLLYISKYKYFLKIHKRYTKSIHGSFFPPCVSRGDIFENYCRSDNLATFGRFCFGVSIITTFPLECFVTREVWFSFEKSILN